MTVLSATLQVPSRAGGSSGQQCTAAASDRKHRALSAAQAQVVGGEDEAVAVLSQPNTSVDRQAPRARSAVLSLPLVRALRGQLSGWLPAEAAADLRMPAWRVIARCDQLVRRHM